MAEPLPRPMATVGIIIPNGKDEIFCFRRMKAPGAGDWSIPGGKIENGQGIEEAAAAEARQETGIEITKSKVVAFLNDLVTWHEEGVHSLVAIVLAEEYDGIPEIREPRNHSDALWVPPNKLPQPHFSPSETGVSLWLAGEMYRPPSE